MARGDDPSRQPSTDQTAPPDRPDQTDHTDQTGRPDQTAPPEQTDQAGQTGQIRLDDLLGATSGRFEIPTWNHTKHIVDLDAGTITRIPAPGREWGTGVDHRPSYVTRLAAAPGEALFVELADGTWRLTSTIRSIRRIGR